MVKGLANVDIQAELLAEVEQMSLEDTIAFIARRESDVVAAANARMATQTVSFRNTLMDFERYTQAAIIIRPSQVPSKQVEVIKVQPTVSISLSVSSAGGNITPQSPSNSQPPSITQHGVLQEDLDQGDGPPRAVVTPSQDQLQASTQGGVSKPMTVAGVMQKQGIPVLDLVRPATRKHLFKLRDAADQYIGQAT
jgi:hypothetical protein